MMTDKIIEDIAESRKDDGIIKNIYYVQFADNIKANYRLYEVDYVRAIVWNL